ncbi:hypothetical protein ACFYNO_05885 [Kitasatospora sp. NPDC006697]|uniref:hypothetical protein n=1 Tax=Kitasatospora sp. NPDC006697 TaxID=3364020 RepID=UPI0036ACCB11
MARKSSTAERRHRWIALSAALALWGALVGGVVAYRMLDGGPTERTVTMDEASRLALARLNLYQAAPVAVTLTADEGGGVVLKVSGVVDYRTHRAVGSYGSAGSAAGTPLDHGLIVWDADGLGLAPALDSSPAWQQAEHLPRSGWSPRAYTSDPLDSGLQLLIGLGADRPDNPLLLAQSGARWLGRERIDGQDCDRIAGPRAQGATPAPGNGDSPLTYWVDGNGDLRRVTMRLPGLGTPTTLEFGGHDATAKLPDAPWAT